MLRLRLPLRPLRLRPQITLRTIHDASQNDIPAPFHYQAAIEVRTRHGRASDGYWAPVSGSVGVRNSELTTSSRLQIEEIANEPIEPFSLEKHPYVPPSESDSRSPCPALNALANHGLL